MLTSARNAFVGLLKHRRELGGKCTSRSKNNGCVLAELVVVELEHVGLKRAVGGKVLEQRVALLEGTLVVLKGVEVSAVGLGDDGVHEFAANLGSAVQQDVVAGTDHHNRKASQVL